MELAFAIERAMDIMAEKLNMDPSRLRAINSIKPGDLSPTGSLMDGNTGNLIECIDKAKELLKWEEGNYKRIDEHTIRAKSLTCMWKAPAMPTNADSGAIITFNEDGSMNLHCPIVEIGQATQTGLAQILAEKFETTLDRVHLVKEVNTMLAPHDWATAASRAIFMAGNAVIQAADDAIEQIKNIASRVLRCSSEDLHVAKDRVFIKDLPNVGLDLHEVVLGYVYPNGNAIEGQVIGKGRYIARGLTDIHKETGKGQPALEWTLGAEGVEVELDLRDFSYKLLKSVAVLDVGQLINPAMARGQIVGAMSMGLSFARGEVFEYNPRGRVINDSLRDFKIMRYGEEPDYFVDYVETSQEDVPYGARGLGEL